MASELVIDWSQVEEVQRQLSKAGEEIRSLQTRLNGVISNANWRGNVATKFRDAWNGQFKTSLNNLERAMDEASADVKAHLASARSADRMT